MISEWSLVHTDLPEIIQSYSELFVTTLNPIWSGRAWINRSFTNKVKFVNRYDQTAFNRNQWQWLKAKIFCFRLKHIAQIPRELKFSWFLNGVWLLTAGKGRVARLVLKCCWQMTSEPDLSPETPDSGTDQTVCCHCVQEQENTKYADF